MPNRTKPAIEPKVRPIRRVVTGHDAAGKSIIVEEAIATHVLALGVAEHGVTDLWRTQKVPADNMGYDDPCKGQLVLAPPRQGTVFRVVEFPPDKDYLPVIDHKVAFSAMGKEAAQSLTGQSDLIMHRTDSVDYVIVIEGEIYAIMDEGEALLRPGDVLIQRGTNHGWSNRTNRPAILAFVLVAADPALPQHGP